MHNLIPDFTDQNLAQDVRDTGNVLGILAGISIRLDNEIKGNLRGYLLCISEMLDNIINPNWRTYHNSVTHLFNHYTHQAGQIYEYNNREQHFMGPGPYSEYYVAPFNQGINAGPAGRTRICVTPNGFYFTPVHYAFVYRITEVHDPSITDRPSRIISLQRMQRIVNNYIVGPGENIRLGDIHA